MNSLNSPVNSPPLKDIPTPGDKVVIVVSDQTRVTRSEVFLPLIIEELNSEGIPDEDITLLFATGMHKGLTPEGKVQIAGEKILKRVKTVIHNAEKEEDMVSLGETSRGTPVKLNRHYVEADFKIITGAIVYHYFAGYGGGRKSIIPGIASQETISANHMLVFDFDREEGVHPKVLPGNLEDNPVHEDMMDGALMAPPDFMLNVILDLKGNIIDAVGGNFLQAHLQGCRKAEALFSVEISKGADLVIVSCGGYPKDINMIQIQKSLYNASRAVKKGGTIILLAECPGGMGSDSFFHWFDCPCPGKAEKSLRARFELNGFTALSIMNITRKSQVIMLSQLPEHTVLKMGMIPVKSMEEALQRTEAALPKNNPLIYVMPYGSMTVPNFSYSSR